jgi:hypothetical protein
MPYMHYTPSYPLISTIIPQSSRTLTLNTLSSVLSPMHTSPLVVANLACLANFAAATNLARASGGAVKFDPHPYTDELVGVTHNLLTQPAPLRDDDDPLNSPFATAVAGENYFHNHRLRRDLEVPVTVSSASRNGPGGPLEPALRIAGLLFLKELIPDSPHNFGGYSVLLELLAECMRRVLAQFWQSAQAEGDSDMEHDEVDAADPMGAIMSRDGATVGGEIDYNMMEFNPSMLDPRLLEGLMPSMNDDQIGWSDSASRSHSGTPESQHHFLQKKTAGRRRKPPAHPRQAVIRPIVLWLCVLGDLISTIAEDNECRQTADERYDRGIYWSCLTEVAGIAGDMDIDDLWPSPADSKMAAREETRKIMTGHRDLVLFRLFDLGKFGPAGWSEERALRRLLSYSF